MPDYTYGPFLVLDETTGEPTAEATGGQLLDVAGGTPQPVYDLLGSPLAELITNRLGVTGSFMADVPYGLVSFGSVALPVISNEARNAGLEAAAAQSAAEAAQAAAESASTSAVAAQSAAEQAAGLVNAPADDAIAAAVNAAGSASRAAVVAAGGALFVEKGALLIDAARAMAARERGDREDGDG